MPLTKQQKLNVENVLKTSLRHKFENYNPEPAAMPFHTRLLGKDRLALFSFIHSLNTNFGTSIFEPVALALAADSFKSAESQATAGTEISSEAHRVIQEIMDGLATAAATPNKPQEIEAIRKVCNKGEMKKVKPTKVDVKLVGFDETIYLFDIKTAKPNAGGFKEFKRTLLEWVAVTLALNPKAKIESIIAIPYNPYDPKPYSRWTMRGMIDLENELKVAEEFWDFLGGKGAFQDLLVIFEKVGLELREEIDAYFQKFNNYKI
ncbi:MAG TPA: TdeIII family type II restriction endonuclease [Leptospiraceae bacterium]|nr:TdeIII family type II restriction endonuclease [Leptospiraceae bacterium]HNC59844.1 TdeIII family type II restriction endonuclease [Leptospiraceae bacterium]HNF57896.1 TdeIII family type II restriction endonuclease [Leptospiraceae bacterium]HNH56448.1 TdeIII family type II restriction endonuclease [Leptospiraceae bacterium]HNM92239.1 TdeIII family type II restriction endonuclease [Leptospiraceae bacterium]